MVYLVNVFIKRLDVNGTVHPVKVSVMKQHDDQKGGPVIPLTEFIFIRIDMIDSLVIGEKYPDSIQGKNKKCNHGKGELMPEFSGFREIFLDSEVLESVLFPFPEKYKRSACHYKIADEE